MVEQLKRAKKEDTVTSKRRLYSCFSHSNFAWQHGSIVVRLFVRSGSTAKENEEQKEITPHIQHQRKCDEA